MRVKYPSHLLLKNVWLTLILVRTNMVVFLATATNPKLCSCCLSYLATYLSFPFHTSSLFTVIWLRVTVCWHMCTFCASMCVVAVTTCFIHAYSENSDKPICTGQGLLRSLIKLTWKICMFNVINYHLLWLFWMWMCQPHDSGLGFPLW